MNPNANGQVVNEAGLAISVTPVETAREARLRYVSDNSPGIQRRRRGKGFSYIGLDEQTIHDIQERRRIKDLVIPPAWQDVWICLDPDGHVQATGRDEKGRKQYIYHPRWQKIRSESKFKRMMAFGQALPVIRERVAKDLSRHGMPRDRVLATVIGLLEQTLIRIGNATYARENYTYGLTTLHNRHVQVSTTKLQFQFRGKHGKMHMVDVSNRRLARVVKHCLEIPGYELFQYMADDGQQHSIDSADVNGYLQEISGQDFTAKDFRTWGSTFLALSALVEVGPAGSNSESKKNLAQVVRKVARRLNNTPAVCRQYYVHPAVITAYQDGSLFTLLERAKDESPKEPSPYDLQPEENLLMAILGTQLKP